MRVLRLLHVEPSEGRITFTAWLLTIEGKENTNVKAKLYARKGNSPLDFMKIKDYIKILSYRTICFNCSIPTINFTIASTIS